MGSATGEAEVAKKPYKNQTAGWLGVVKLDHLGAQVGHAVEPFGTVYLTDDEAILTARAPRDPKDNPFEEQVFQFIENDTGNQVEAPMRPLVLILDAEGLPGEERYVPGIAGSTTDESIAANRREAAAAIAEGAGERTVPSAPVQPTPIVPSGTAVPGEHASPASAEAAQSWVENAERSEAPQPGALGGSDQPATTPPEGAQERVEGASPGATAPQAPAPPPPTPEEHAAHLGSGEETGAAEIPAGQAPEGEYASHEEVGSPDAPTQRAP